MGLVFKYRFVLLIVLQFFSYQVIVGQELILKKYSDKSKAVVILVARGLTIDSLEINLSRPRL